jgi:two-component system cell cycle sensor histidine kinase/response regulator CckA
MDDLLKPKGQLVAELQELREQVAALLTHEAERKEVEASLQATLHDLKVHQEELRAQNEELRIAQQELESSRRKYRRLFDFAPIGYFTIDHNAVIREVNLTGTEMLGYGRSHLIGKPLLLYVALTSRDALASYLRGVFEGSGSSVEVTFLSRDGRTFPVVLKSAPIRDGTGTGQSCLTAAMDITERKQAEEALRESEERYRTLVTQAPIGIITCDHKGNITGLNPAILQILGSPGEEATRQFNMLTTPSLVEASISGDIRRCMEEDTPVVSERPYRSYWGKEVVMRLRLVPLKDEQGEVSGVLATVEDISEQRQLEAQLRQAQKLEAIGTLAGGVAHEFNNILTGIIGNLSLVMPEVEPGSQIHQDLQNAERSARRAAVLTRQLLAFSRKSRGERFEPVNLNPVVEEVADLLRLTIDPRIEINTYPAAALWPVEADPNQVHQMLMNLCLNARDAIKEYLRGECPLPERPADEPLAITVETENITLDEEYCRAHLEAQPGQFVCLSVSDNGCGMDAESQARAFDPFFTTKEVGQGTGLGLALVFGIVKGHDGFINLYSEPGVGTTFKVYLPRAGEQMATEAETEAEPAAPPTGSETILLVDDKESVRNTGRRILESRGYTVLLANDGQKALEVYEREKERIDLVLLDLTMPRLSGLETLREILQLDPEAKVILASGYSANGPGSAALAEGAAAFVQKPYDLHKLAQAVRVVLDEQ